MSESESFEETTFQTKIFGKHRPHVTKDYSHLETTEDSYIFEEFELNCAGNFQKIYEFKKNNKL